MRSLHHAAEHYILLRSHRHHHRCPVAGILTHLILFTNNPFELNLGVAGITTAPTVVATERHQPHGRAVLPPRLTFITEATALHCDSLGSQSPRHNHVHPDHNPEYEHHAHLHSTCPKQNYLTAA